jgi:hypothetical protein
VADAASAPMPSVVGRVSSYVEWAPIIGGAVAAAAISLVLFAFGSAIGLTAISPWPNSGLPAWLVAVIVALWILVVQAGSYALGGYLAGRLRMPLPGTTETEKHFRDGSHGFLVWALGMVISAILLSWTAGAIVKTGAEAAATATSGTVEGALRGGASVRGNSVDPIGYAIDRLLRPAATAAPAPAGATSIPGPSSPTSAEHDEALRVFMSALSAGSLPAEDRSYLAGQVSARTGLPAAEAEKRVDETFSAIQQAETQAREAADHARRGAAIAGFLTAAALLIAAAAAAAGAGLGGKHRDENSTLRMFGRERFW